MSNYIDELKTKLLEITNINNANALLVWDQQTYMPEKGSVARGMQQATLNGLSHNIFVSNEMGNLLNKLKENKEFSKLSDDDKVIVDRCYEDYDKAKEVPNELVMEITKARSEAYMVWTKARAESNFKLFEPHLEKMLGYGKQLADVIGYKKSPYDALLDRFERKLTVDELDPLFNDLREKIVPFLEAIQNSNIKTNPEIIKKHYPSNKQWNFTVEILKYMGYDFDCGRQDKSVHPFTISFHPNDVRVTTRIKENYLSDALSSSIHEGGHALYEQGLSSEYYGTALCEYVSLGIHESQSRLWENLVGKSKSFWKFFYPKLKNYFPDTLKDISMGDFIQSYSHVNPSFIRVDADEVTYNLHIILRYEMERDAVEGKIKVKDFPEIWNSKMKEYLGITPPNDAKGVLQDVHWTGIMGYFPTYTLGNLYSAQLYHFAKNEIPNLEEQFEKGDFSLLLKWLREKIHKQGRRYYPKDLIKKATGEEPSADYFINHLYDRYGETYQIARMMM